VMINGGTYKSHYIMRASIREEVLTADAGMVSGHGA